MMLKSELYLGLRGPMVERMKSWSPLVSVSSSMCVLSLKFLMCVSCYLCFLLFLWVNFVCAGCWLNSYMIFLPMEFGHKLHGSPHLLGGEIGAAYMQHLHQRRWARESMSLDNHLLLHSYMIMIEWMFNLFTFYPQWLGIGISIWSLFWCCCLVILVVAGVLVYVFFHGVPGYVSVQGVSSMDGCNVPVSISPLV